MNISRYFIDRPIFAAVLSFVIFIAGFISLFRLPISEYPEAVPPQVVVSAQFPGANPKVVAETVATPLEEQLNGIDNLLYTDSQATSDGGLKLTATFKIGTRPEEAETAVQNRINRALPRLPDVVRLIGVTTERSSPNLSMVVHLVSPDHRYDALYLRNYAVLHVRDQLLRLRGVGQTWLTGSGDYAMRIWLNPAQMSARGLSTGDVTSAIREQNLQVAAGVIGAPPTRNAPDFQLAVSTQGRLTTEQEFGDIIVRSTPDGSTIRVRDIGRVELGQSTYAVRSLLHNEDAFGVAIFQAPDSNALQMSKDVRAEMELLAKDFPPGLEYRIIYDTTAFVNSSIESVIHTLFEAVALVVLVVIVFLQTWRAAIIPLLAVPIAVIGTFAVLLLLGYSINTLTLFALVLSIGIVVDDAIVVVENVEQNIATGKSPHDAAVAAMQEVSGPIIAIALVLCAVFVPLAFVSGLSGQFFRQFAVTIAISTVISAFNSLTLSPALASRLLRDHSAPKDRFQRVIDASLGWLFRPFNRVFTRASNGYQRAAGLAVHHKAIVFGLYVLLGLATILLFNKVPPGFVPQQDKQYLVTFASLPAGSSLQRTEKVIRQMGEVALKDPGVLNVIGFPGLSINGFTASPNDGIMFMPLKGFEQRTSLEEGGVAIAARTNKGFSAIKGAYLAAFPPPAVSGLGTVGGFKLQIEDRQSLGFSALNDAMTAVLAKAYAAPELVGVFSTFQVNVPQLYADIDRTKAKQLGVDLRDVYDSLQANLGSLYVNDFNRFGRTYQVVVQADSQFRNSPEAISDLKVRGRDGAMIPLGSLLKVQPTFGPGRVSHYNGYDAADLSGGPSAGYSSGEAQAAMEKILRETLPPGFSFEWTELVLPGEDRRQHDGLHLSAVRAAGVPCACSAVRKLDPAPVHHLDRADVHPLRAGRRLAHRWGPQHLHTGGIHRARWTRLQERHPHRGVRGRSGEGWHGDAGCDDQSLSAAPSSDPDDVDRFHRGHPAACVRERCRVRDAACNRHRGVLGNAWRDAIWTVPYSRLLRHPQAPIGRGDTPYRGSGGDPCIGSRGPWCCSCAQVGVQRSDPTTHPCRSARLPLSRIRRRLRLPHRKAKSSGRCTAIRI